MEERGHMLTSVVEEVRRAVNREVSGAQLLHTLLSAPWLHALLKVYDCLLEFKALDHKPALSHVSTLSYQIMSDLKRVPCPSAEVRELYEILGSAHMEALLSCHDSIAQADFEPVLPPLPEDIPEDEEAMRIVCLVKNNQPLNGEERRGSLGAGEVGGGLIQSRWNSLRRLTLDRFVPGRRAWSREELKTKEGGAFLLSHPPDDQPRPFLPRYASTGSCCICHQTTEFWGKGLNLSAPSVYNPAPNPASSPESTPHLGPWPSAGSANQDYAYPPPPIPAYSISVPTSPVLHRARNVPTPGRAPRHRHGGRTPPRARTAPSSPATRRLTRQQGVSTLPHTEDQRNTREGNAPPDRRPSCLAGEHGRPRLPSLGHTKQRSAEGGWLYLDAREMRSEGQGGKSAVESDGRAEALCLLVQVLEKLQFTVLARRPTNSSPGRQGKRQTPPLPPPRVSSISRKSRPLSSSPSPSSVSSSSSSSCVSSCGNDLVTPGSSPSPRVNGGCKKRSVDQNAPLGAVGGRTGQVCINKGGSPGARRPQDTTGCLSVRKTRERKKKGNKTNHSGRKRET